MDELRQPVWRPSADEREASRALRVVCHSLACSRSLRNRGSQRDIDEGRVERLNSDEREELRRLRREVKVLARSVSTEPGEIHAHQLGLVAA